MTYALEILDLKKTYPGGTEALKGISLTVKEGDFYALLGPNGAGKSSTIGIIGSLVTKTSGSNSSPPVPGLEEEVGRGARAVAWA